MIRSMTGFGRVKQLIGANDILVEIRSVNNRYLDIQVKQPRLYGFLEERVKALAGQYISRGKVDIYIGIDTVQSANIEVALDDAYVKSYIAALGRLRDEYGLKDDISVMRVASNRDIFHDIKTDTDADELWEDVKSVAQAAFGEFIAMRESEGERLSRDIAERIQLCKEKAALIDEQSATSVAAWREKYTARLQEMLGDIVISEDRILTETALYADKISITEEIVRLNSHFEQFYAILEEPNAIGRKLDFLMQEINREINTIGSKANNSEVAKIVVEVKSELEKIREQIQNLE